MREEHNEEEDAAMMVKETAEEKRLRMTKSIIGEYAVDDKQNFFANLMAKTSTDMDIIRQDDDEVVKRMKLKMLEQKGKLFYKLADKFCQNTEWEGEDDREHEIQTERVFMKGHKQAITCLEWVRDNRSVITGSKDCSLIRCKSHTTAIDLMKNCRGLGKPEETDLQRGEVQPENLGPLRRGAVLCDQSQRQVYGDWRQGSNRSRVGHSQPDTGAIVHGTQGLHHCKLSPPSFSMAC